MTIKHWIDVSLFVGTYFVVSGAIWLVYVTFAAVMDLKRQVRELSAEIKQLTERL